MKTVDLLQRTPEWHAWRNAGVSASDAATILGRNPDKTPWRLWAERTGLVLEPDLGGNPYVRLGIGLEPRARALFEQEHDTMLIPLCAEDDRHPVIRASFDGVDECDVPVELKVPAERRFAAVAKDGLDSEPGRLYWPQVQAQTYIAGTDYGWLCFLNPVGNALLQLRVERDERFIQDELVPGMLAFWERLKSNEAPPMDPERDLFIPAGEAAGQWNALAGDYRRREAAYREAEAKAVAAKAHRDRLQTQLVALMGEHLLAEAGGVRVTRFAKKGSVDYKALIQAQLPDLPETEIEAHRRKSSSQVKVTCLADRNAQVPFDPEKVEAARQAAEDGQGFY